MAHSREKSKGRRISGNFLALPHVVMDSEDYRMLSGSATKVLQCLMRQLKASNNGDLSATFGQVSAWGIGSKSTLAAALDELMTKRLIQRTREGRFLKPGGCCALYAVTWRPIDDCGGKLEVSPTSTAPRKFTLERAQNPVQKLYPHGTETVPMSA
jgi:hypothetical protein